MPLLSLAELLEPISDDLPAGENLEYSLVADLERLATGRPGALDPKTREIVGAEEPEWRKVKDATLSSFGSTKDLRAAVILNRALLSLHGLQGLGEGLQLVHAMLAKFWDSAYPQLDASEGDDPVERLNVLANLSDPDGLLRALRSCRIAESREVGQFTLRDLDLASGRLSPPEGVEAPSQALLAAAWKTGDPDTNAARRQGVESALQAIDDVERLFREKTGDVPGFGALRTALSRIRSFYNEVAPAAGAVATAEEASDPRTGLFTSAPIFEVGGGTAPGLTLASREDALKLLEKIATFVRAAEPSSPAPMFIDRAIKVLQMDFSAIVRELMPDSKDRIEMLGGVSLDE